jgi:C1A family cysteine protease
MPYNVARFGWIPDLPDNRDFLFTAPPAVVRKLPLKVDLQNQSPPIYDQQQLGSCTANAIGAAFEFELKKQNPGKDFMPSRLFIYYNERVIEHTVNSDSGAMIRDGIKTVNKQGVCNESIWPYEIFKFMEKPNQACYKDALLYQVVSYQRISRSLDQMKGCLADGYPFVFGFTVYESFESPIVANTGILNMPKKNEKPVGGHAVLAVGYDDKEKRFIVRNSWGTGWGLHGYFTMPYDYLLSNNTQGKLADDFWTIRLVEIPAAAKENTKQV